MPPEIQEDEDDLDAELALFEQEIEKVRPSKLYASRSENPKPKSQPPAPITVSAGNDSRHPAQPPRTKNHPVPSPIPIQSHSVSWQPPSNSWSHTPQAFASEDILPAPHASLPPPPSNVNPAQLFPNPPLAPASMPLLQPPSIETPPQIHTPPSVDSREEESQQPKNSTIAKRTAAGKVWRDPTLEEWPADDHRLFVGDLGPDATDSQLTNAFSKYSSFNMARVVKDKRTSNCRGYGFISFGTAADMLAAVKEMNGKYVGSRPIKLRRSNWKKRSLTKDKWKQVHAFRSISKR